MSHGSHKDVAALNAAIRKVEAEVGQPIAVLVDLQGPKLRVGRMAAGTDLEPGRPFRLDLDRAEGDATGAPLPHREIFEAPEPGKIRRASVWERVGQYVENPGVAGSFTTKKTRAS